MPNTNASNFAAGFTRGLANVLNQRRQDQIRADERRQDLNAKLASLGLEHGLFDFGDAEHVAEGIFGPKDPKAKKKAGAGPDERDVFTNVIGHVLSQNQGSDDMTARDAAAAPVSGSGRAVPQAVPSGSTPLQALAPGGAASPQQAPAAPVNADPRSGGAFMGVATRTPAEAQGQTDQRLIERVNFARTKLLPALQATDPSMTLDDALQIMKIPAQTLRTGTQFGGLVQGELNDGTLAYGRQNVQTGKVEVMDPNTGQMVDAVTLGGWAPRTASASSSMGQWTEKAAAQLGYKGGAAEARKAGPEAMKKVNDLAQQLSAQNTGAGAAARATEASKAPLTTNQKFQNLTDLQNTWRKAEAPQHEMERQYTLMKTGLDRFNKGDKIGGSQAVLVTFQKILDPTSVVRESEYSRTPEGLGLITRLEGAAQRLMTGGAGVPPEELAGMVETARQFLEGNKSWNDLERERLTATAKDFGLNPERIFGAGTGGATPAPAGAAPATPQGAVPGVTMKDGKLYVNGVLMPGQ